MTSFFLSILNISFTATFVAVAVILLRFLFKKAPRWISCLLWALVGLRLMVPITIESEFSLVPSIDKFWGNATFELAQGTKYPEINTVLNDSITPVAESKMATELMDVLAFVWLAFAALMLVYGIVSYIGMYLRVRTAVPLKKNIYQSENVRSPFVLGFIKPKVYIPFNLKGRTLKYVLAHENAHIKRKDHIVKPLAFLLLCFHWFNPVLWLSYVLLCRDIEVACDEKVIKDFSINKRKNYAFALLECKVKSSNIAVCPVAFGEVNVKARIKKTLKYKKPAMWIIAITIGVSVIAAGCLLTNPKAEIYYVSTEIHEYPTSSIITEPDTNSTEPSEAEAYETTVPAEATEIVTTAPETEAPSETTEAYEEYYDEYYEEDYYYEDEYYEDDYYYEEETWLEVPPLEYEPLVPSYVENGQAISAWTYKPPLTQVEKQNQALLSNSSGVKKANILNQEPWYPTFDGFGNQHLQYVNNSYSIW